MNHLPKDPKARKDVPLYSGLMRYFPKALAAVAELSRIGNEQHNPGKPMHWDRSKSGDELDALARHLLEAGSIDTDTVRHSTKVVWRALANLEKELEQNEVSVVQSMEDHPAHPGHHPKKFDGRDYILSPQTLYTDEDAYKEMANHYNRMVEVCDEHDTVQEYVTDPITGVVKGKRYE